jgi:four helix bundle protein
VMEKPHYRLNCWKDSFRLSVDLYKVTRSFPSDEKFGIISQVRRAATSIPVNIAEGAARNSTKEFIQFLYISLGSLSELDTFLLLCIELGYLENEIGQKHLSELDRIGKQITGLIKKLKSDIANRGEK